MNFFFFISVSLSLLKTLSQYYCHHHLYSGMTQDILLNLSPFQLQIQTPFCGPLIPFLSSFHSPASKSYYDTTSNFHCYHYHWHHILSPHHYNHNHTIFFYLRVVVTSQNPITILLPPPFIFRHDWKGNI